MQPIYYPSYPLHYPAMNRNGYGDQDRFFPFLFPFLLGGVTGLAASPFFFNRPPVYPPYPPAYPVYPTPYPAYPPYPGYRIG
ncbi:hypothetical protein [Bacillus massiliglaciei]|uniref:hypothetical protein n=1 Tax=Bacillus massiliglaciei TaxID=1816693 RepID=UPI001F40F7D8|nr:hypothetical protein [Bacillus massiliglaciei]